MNKLVSLLAALLLALAPAGAALAQQYKWVDQNGKTQYGDVPPPGVKATPLRGPASGSAPAAPSSKAASSKTGTTGAKGKEKELTPEQAFQKRREDERANAEKEAKARQEKEASQSNCTSARSSLAQLESGQRIARTNAQGERYYVEDDQRAAETERARRAVGEWCK